MNTIQNSFKNSIYSYNNLQTKKGVKQNDFAQIQQSFVSVPSFAYKANFAPNISFKGVDKVDENLYSDTDKFAEYFEQKLKTKMCVKSEEDVQNIIDNVVKATDSDEKTVCSVISRLTQFSDYSHLRDLECGLDNLKFSKLYSPLDMFSLNSVFHYLELKGQFGGSSCFAPGHLFTIIDNKFLDYCETLDKNSGCFKVFKSYLNKSAIIDGWEKKGVSQTMFGAECDLQTATINVIKEMKSTGENLDTVLNGDIRKRCKELFGNECASQMKTIRSSNKPLLNAKDIAEHLNPYMPNKEKIAKFVRVVADNVKVSDEKMSKQEKEMAICKYLDETFEPYSVERINIALKDIHKQIEEKVVSLGKTMDDVIYVVPKIDKSFSLISYQYAKVNDIPLSQFLQDDFSPIFRKADAPPVKKDKVYVVLDDFAGSGDSLVTKMNYRGFKNLIYSDKNTNLILAPIFMTDVAKENFDFYINELFNRQNIDFYVTNNKFDSKKYMTDFLEDKDRKDVLNLVGGNGYSSLATSVAFPFSVTDTNSNLSSLFSTFFVRDYISKHLLKGTEADWRYAKKLNEMIWEMCTNNE